MRVQLTKSAFFYDVSICLDLCTFVPYACLIACMYSIFICTLYPAWFCVYKPRQRVYSVAYVYQYAKGKSLTASFLDVLHLFRSRL
uniref:Uncharacterized protein n=1 Tax=Fundulus heteroclitus TaxID=8078 RepID=A0A146PK09_FUNHE